MRNSVPPEAVSTGAILRLVRRRRRNQRPVGPRVTGTAHLSVPMTAEERAGYFTQSVDPSKLGLFARAVTRRFGRRGARTVALDAHLHENYGIDSWSTERGQQDLQDLIDRAERGG